MRELTNLGWPDTPYGADERPVAKRVHLLTGMAMHFADGGQDTAPVSAAAVFLPVHRTRQTTIAPETLHFGFRLAVADHPGDGPELLRLVDRILVQGRRMAAALAWHSFPDDLHVMRALAAERLPGVTSVGEAWQDRGQRERGCAPLVDTAEDLDPSATLAADAGLEHGIAPGERLLALQRPDAIQRLHDDLTDSPTDTDAAVRALGAAVLTQALTVALLAGHATGRLSWTAPFDLGHALHLTAWHLLGPELDPDPAPSR